MKYYFFSIFFLLFSTILFSQNSAEKYYKYVNKAELAICRERYKSAGKFYRKAFTYKPPFSIDLGRAYALNYFFLGDTIEALQCAHSLMQYASPDVILDFLIMDTVKEKSMYNHLKNMYDTTTVTVIPELQKALEIILNEDQEERVKAYDYEDGLIEKKAPIYSKNIDKLERLYQEYGHLNEKNAGAFFENIIFIVLLHYAQIHHISGTHIIYQDVLQGHFDARQYIALAGMIKQAIHSPAIIADTLNYGNAWEQFEMINETLFLYKPEHVKTVNKNRRYINLSETWADFEKKVIYSFSQKKTPFVFTIFNRLFYEEDQNIIEIEKRKKEIDEGKVKGSYYTKN